MNFRLLIGTLALGLLSLPSARAEIVERELGTNASGQTVTGHVLQGGRQFRRSARVSGLPARRIERSRRGNHSRAFVSGTPWWYVPVIPLHCGGTGFGGSFTLWHGWGDRVSVTILR